MNSKEIYRLGSLRITPFWFFGVKNLWTFHLILTPFLCESLSVLRYLCAPTIQQVLRSIMNEFSNTNRKWGAQCEQIVCWFKLKVPWGKHRCGKPMVSGFRSENEPYMAVFRIYVFYIRVPHKKKKTCSQFTRDQKCPPVFSRNQGCSLAAILLHMGTKRSQNTNSFCLWLSFTSRLERP